MAYDGEQRMIFGATTFGLFMQMLPAIGDERDPWMDRILSCPATVISSTLVGPCETRYRRTRTACWTMRQ